MNPIEIAFKEYGVAEVVGSTHNPRIVEYFEKTGNSWVKDDETAWCAAFVGFCLEEAGLEGTGQLNARSYLNWGIPALEPKLGDIVVFWRGQQSGWQGHVGFYITERNGYIYVLGGNQMNEVNISKYSKDRLLGYRYVEEQDKKLISKLLKALLSLTKK